MPRRRSVEPEREPPIRQSAPAETVYDLRFGERERSAKEAVWREIGRFLQRRFIPTDARVMDIATDTGYFIRNIAAAERWASDLRDTSASMPTDVRFLQADGLALAEVAPNDHFDIVFMSNYLEHLDSAESVIEQLRVARRLLRVGGRVIVLQPNIKLVGPAYWDFIDHRVPLTEESLSEAAAFAGFEKQELIRRFLPYSVKGRLPAHRLLVRTYLRFPPAWRLFGKQTLYVGRRER
jgi:SAM-dependent methyltransferase